MACVKNTSECQINIVNAYTIYAKSTCKVNATAACRSSVADLAALYRKSSNADECKDKDPEYKKKQDLWRSCSGEYT